MTNAVQARGRGMAVPTLLILLGIIPVVISVVRLVAIVTGTLGPELARFAERPWPVALHMITVVPYSLLGALQFAPALRKNRWHRITGRLLWPMGLIAALTGLWMTIVYPWAPHDNVVVYLARLAAGSGMTASMVLGGVALLRRDFATHGEWMIRAYALGMGAGTQVITHLPWIVTTGMPDGNARAFAMASAWVINAAVAEWVIRRARARSTRRQPTASGLSSSGSLETRSLAQ